MSSTVPPHPGPLHHPGRPEGEVEVEAEVEVKVEVGAGCHLEGVVGATTMEARPGVAAAAAVEGAVVAVAVAVDVAPLLDDERA